MERNFYFSQRDPRWANLKLGTSGLTVKNFGCAMTACAIMLSYYFDREVLPSELLSYLNTHNGFNSLGQIYWDKVCRFTGGKLRVAFQDGPQEGELTYGVRQVRFGSYDHWVLSHPRIKDVVIDPWDAATKPFNSFYHTGRIRYFFGKPVAPQEYPVDHRYGRKRTWTTFLTEQKYAFYWVPNTPASYIFSKIHRKLSDRELCAFVYGGWDVGSVFENKVGNAWLYKTKKDYLK